MMLRLNSNRISGSQALACMPAAAWRPRRGVVVTRCKAAVKPREQEFLFAKKVGCTAMLAALAISLTGTSLWAPPALADSVYEKRQADMQKRKELLQQAREKALSKGGVADGQDPTKATAATANAAAEKVNEANAEVEKANKARESEVARMRKSLKGELKNYDASAKKSEKVLKPGADAPDNPSWFSNFLEQKQKGNEPKDAPPPAPPEAQPSKTLPLGGFLKPKAETEEPGSSNQEESLPAPTSSPVQKASDAPPSLGFSQPSQPKEKQDPVQPLPPAPKKEPQLAQPEAKSAPPAASSKPAQQAQQNKQPQALQTSPAPPKPALPAPPQSAKPQPTPPAPTAQKRGVQPVQPAKKQQTKARKEDGRKGKRKGPLPAFLVQLVLLASFGGLGYLFFFQEEKTNAGLTAVVKSITSLYKKVEGAVKKQTKKA